MKKVALTIAIIVISIIVFIFSFDYKQKQDPTTFYRVYLKGEVIGVIESKEELEDYINEQNKEYQEKYNVERVNIPNSLEIKKITTYNKKVDKVKYVYEKIVDQEPFTIPGIEFNLKNGDKKTTIYVIDEEVFKKSVEIVEKTFVGTEDYNSYNEDNQPTIQTTGKQIKDIYVQDQITTKITNIPVTEEIYIDENELSRYLVFGPNESKTIYTVKLGDTISDVAFNNKISVEEFMISNPTFTSEKNLLFPGQEVVISETNPQISIVTESYVVEDKVVKYQTDYKYDENAVLGDDKVTQAGEDGLERVSQEIQSVNGTIAYVNVTHKEELKPVINEIVVKGKKDIPNQGSWNNWLWPTRSGWTISSVFGYRPNPWTGKREYHTGLDIAGTGEGSPIYAVSNGTVIEAGYRSANGKYVCIDHNVGLYSCYNHMSRILVKVGQVVARGTTIGLVGQTGAATGPHLHLEAWSLYPWKYGTRGLINPKSFYPQIF